MANDGLICHLGLDSNVQQSDLKVPTLKFVFKHEIHGHWPFRPRPIWPLAI